MARRHEMKKKFYPERDELRGRFTRFMEVLVKHARINYVHMRDRGIPTIPLETVPEHLAAKEEKYFSSSTAGRTNPIYAYQ